MRERTQPDNYSTRQDKRLQRQLRGRQMRMESSLRIPWGSNFVLCTLLTDLLIFLAFLLYKDYSLHYIDKKAGQGNDMTGLRSQTWCGRGCDAPPRSSSWKGPGIPAPGCAVSMRCSVVSPFRACLSSREPPSPNPAPAQAAAPMTAHCRCTTA